MAFGVKEGKEVAGGSETGRRLLDIFNPSEFGLGDAAPEGTQAALTAADATAIDAVYDAVEQAVLENLRTRLNELEARLQTLGLIA